ncbi:uncharacterized protein [Pyxicephalus adspersus]|uniref:uncharacterized protein n=1 Tax=Pyxicephalus adspersus TaxID=30357 RepID=UPI003B5C7405
MKNENNDKRKLRQKILDQMSPVISIHRSVIQSKNNIDWDNHTEKINFRYPHKANLELAPHQHTQKQPIIRQITIDLRPLLKQVVDDCEADILDTSEASKQDNKRSYAGTDMQPPQQRNLEAFSISLPSMSSCKSRDKSRLSQTIPRTVSLVTVTDKGTLTCDSIQKSRNSSPVCFPKVLLNQVPLQKSAKEQRPLNKMNASWLGVEKLQIPMSELVRVVKERSDSGHHTLIAQVLCSLREKQEKLIHHAGKDDGALVRMHSEISHETSHIPCAFGGTRLTWMKRN